MAESAKAKAAAAAPAKDETPDTETVEEVDDSIQGRLSRIWIEVNEGYEDDAARGKATALQRIEDLQFALQALEPYKKD